MIYLTYVTQRILILQYIVFTVDEGYLDVRFCTHGDDLIEFSVEDHLTDGPIMGVRHLHCVLNSPSQWPGVYHTRS